MEFCSHLPPNCPPLDAISFEIKVYCLVSDPPKEDDFHSLQEKNPNKDYSPRACQASGLSVFPDLEGIDLARKVSRTLRKKKLAKGHLSENSGKIKNTPSDNTGDTHHTWWPAKNINPSVLFSIVPQNL